MVSIQTWLPEYDYSTRNASLAPLYADWEKQKEFYAQRRRETQEVIDMLTDRVEAELTYAMRLDKISNLAKSFSIGKLAEEVENYKMSCAARASQAAEVSENVHQDCIEPLKNMLEKQEAEFNQVLANSKKKQDKLQAIDADIKRTAMAYFKAARDAEESVVKYQKIKYEAEMTYINRQQVYDNMMNKLMELKDCEVEYKETVDTANNFVQKFRRVILVQCRQCRDLEIERCSQIHSSINQFVVFEMSAEMNNKYDTANFAKVLEEFSQQREMKAIDEYLYGVEQTSRANAFDDAAPDGDRSASNRESEGQQSTVRIDNRGHESRLSSDSAPQQTKDGDEPQEDLRTHEQLCDEITVVENSFIPIVMNPKFEFVPFESRLNEEQNPFIARIDINQLTQVQLREPPARVSDFYRANISPIQKQKNGVMSEQDKQELMLFIIHKIFCVGQHQYSMSELHKEYVFMIQLICQASLQDRNMLVSELKSIFQGRQNVTQLVFHNLIKAVESIYESYCPEIGAEQGFEFNLTDLETVRKITQQYFMQIPQRNSNQASVPLQMTPCLEAQLKSHRIWSYSDIWLGLSKDLEITNILAVHFFQDQMASYEVEPALLREITLYLVQEVRSSQQKSAASNGSDITADSNDAEQGCHSRIEQYRQIYEERQEEKRMQLQQIEEQKMQNKAQLQKHRSMINMHGGSHATPYGGGGLRQQLTSLVGGLFSGGGIRIGDGSARGRAGSPRAYGGVQANQRSSTTNNGAHQPSDLGGGSRPSLASLLNKGSSRGSGGNPQLARRASPADRERMRSPLAEVIVESEESDAATNARKAQSNQLIVKKANYVSNPKRLIAGRSRSPPRPQINTELQARNDINLPRSERSGTMKYKSRPLQQKEEANWPYNQPEEQKTPATSQDELQDGSNVD